MQWTATQLGAFIRDTRKSIGLTQADVATAAGTGLRFIVELENGKQTCELGKALVVLNTLGITLDLKPPSA